MNQVANSPKNQQDRLKGYLFLVGVAIMLLIVGGGFAIKLVLENVGTTAMQLASEGKLTAAQIEEVEFLQRKATDPWPFTPADYDRLPSVALPVTEYPELIRLLAMTEMKRIHGNHPHTPAEGILRIKLKDGRQFIIFFDIRHEGDKPYYVEFEALLEGRTNPNLSRHYSFPEETPEMVDFLRKNNAWVDQALTADEARHAK